MATRQLGEDRVGSVGLRAVARDPRAEIRGARLEVAHRPIGIVVPYLALDLAGASLARRRGVTDALGLRLRHSDRALHLALSPSAPLERIVFDIAEQFRCESLAEPTLRGVRMNTAVAFDEWSERARADQIAETGVGLLVFTITHMLRSRLLRRPTSESVDEIIEVARGRLGKLVGHALEVAPTVTASQTEFATPAREIARLVAELAADAGELDDATPESAARNRLLIPIDWNTLDEELAGEGTDRLAPVGGSDYMVFTRDHDIEVRGESLYRPETLRALRRELDGLAAAQAVSVTRLAQRLQRLFPTRLPDGWSSGELDGELDPSRLSQVIVEPLGAHVRRQPRLRPAADASVTFLVDTSGSMKIQRFETIALLVDTMVRALELAGITSEVLGFTTACWAGGRPAEAWRALGSPDRPGRLTELQHIVYKRADESWRQARWSLAAMLRTDHYREGVDGEALEWAAGRLRERTEQRRALVLISDGIPSESSTLRANGDRLLADHLCDVARGIEHDRHHAVELGAICVDHDLADSFTNAITADLSGTLTIGDYDVLHRLFGRR